MFILLPLFMTANISVERKSCKNKWLDLSGFKSGSFVFFITHPISSHLASLPDAMHEMYAFGFQTHTCLLFPSFDPSPLCL